MATDRLDVPPGAFLAQAAGVRPRHTRTAWLLGAAALVVAAAGALVVPALAAAPAGPRATVAAFGAPQRAGDRLADDDVVRPVVDPSSTRLLVRTSQGAHYAALSAAGDLCLIRVPDGDLPSEVCVPDRVGADATIGTEGAGQVRLVADGASRPPAAEGWTPAGPNVWLRS